MKYAPDIDSEDHPGWNLAPLIGVLVALMAVFMAAAPARTDRIVLDYTYGCMLCMGGRCDRVEELRVAVGDNGLVRINGHEMAVAELSEAVQWREGPGARVSALVEVAPGATYGEATAVLAQLRKVGIPESSLQVSGLRD